MKFKGLFSNRLWFSNFTPRICSLKKINIHFSKPPVVLSCMVIRWNLRVAFQIACGFVVPLPVAHIPWKKSTYTSQNRLWFCLLFMVIRWNLRVSFQIACGFVVSLPVVHIPWKKSTYTSQNHLWFCLLLYSHSMKFKGLFSNRLWFCGFTPRGSYYHITTLPHYHITTLPQYHITTKPQTVLRSVSWFFQVIWTTGGETTKPQAIWKDTLKFHRMIIK